MKPSTLLFALAVIVSGCTTIVPQADSASVMGSPARARLSPNDALKLAVALAETRGVKVTNYKGNPLLTFNGDKIEWVVFFERVNVDYIAYGDHFTIYVADATGATRFVGGH